MDQRNVANINAALHWHDSVPQVSRNLRYATASSSRVRTGAAETALIMLKAQAVGYGASAGNVVLGSPSYWLLLRQAMRLYRGQPSFQAPAGTKYRVSDADHRSSDRWVQMAQVGRVRVELAG